MSIRFARAMAILWVIAFLATFAAGLACAVVSEWRVRVSSAAPTPANSVAYIDHGRTYYAPPVVAKWYNRSHAVFPPLLACFAATTLIAAVAAARSDVVGRKWVADHPPMQRTGNGGVL